MKIKDFIKEYGFEATKDVVRYEEIELCEEIMRGDWEIVCYSVYAVLNTSRREIDIEYRCQELDIVTDDENEIAEYIQQFLIR